MELLPFKYKIIRLLFVHRIRGTMQSMLAFHFSPEACRLMEWFLAQGDTWARRFPGARVYSAQRDGAAIRLPPQWL